MHQALSAKALAAKALDAVMQKGIAPDRNHCTKGIKCKLRPVTITASNAFAPDAFAPDAFAPDAFAPDAFASNARSNVLHPLHQMPCT